MLKAHFLAGLIFLSGCSSLSVNHTHTPLAFLKQQSNLCFINLIDDPQLASISYFVALESIYEEETHYELLDNSDFPTSAETVAINNWETKLEQCYKMRRETYAYEVPGVVRCLTKLEDEQKSLVQSLANGKLTYGQFSSMYYFAYANNKRVGQYGCEG